MASQKTPRLLIFGCVLKPVAVEEAFLKQKIWTLHILAYERGVDRKVFHKFTSKRKKWILNHLNSANKLYFIVCLTRIVLGFVNV